MSYPRYPAYSDSGIEWLDEAPVHWNTKRMRFVVELNPSKQEIRANDAGFEVSFLPMEAIGDDGQLSLAATRELAEVQSGYTYFAQGDVAVAKITPCFENGKGAVMQGLRNGIGFGTTELTIIRPSRNIDSVYLYYFSMSTPFRRLGEASMYGAGGQKCTALGLLDTADRVIMPPVPAAWQGQRAPGPGGGSRAAR
jgi:type I restriction enzyme S subunit